MGRIIEGPFLGQEAYVKPYGLGRVTELFGDDEKVGVTPYVAGYQMNFSLRNVDLVVIETDGRGSSNG